MFTQAFGEELDCIIVVSLLGISRTNPPKGFGDQLVVRTK